MAFQFSPCSPCCCENDILIRVFSTDSNTCPYTFPINCPHQVYTKGRYQHCPSPPGPCSGHIEQLFVPVGAFVSILDRSGILVTQGSIDCAGLYQVSLPDCSGYSYLVECDPCFYPCSGIINGPFASGTANYFEVDLAPHTGSGTWTISVVSGAVDSSSYSANGLNVSVTALKNCCSTPCGSGGVYFCCDCYPAFTQYQFTATSSYYCNWHERMFVILNIEIENVLSPSYEGEAYIRVENGGGCGFRVGHITSPVELDVGTQGLPCGATTTYSGSGYLDNGAYFITCFADMQNLPCNYPQTINFSIEFQPTNCFPSSICIPCAVCGDDETLPSVINMIEPNGNDSADMYIGSPYSTCPSGEDSIFYGPGKTGRYFDGRSIRAIANNPYIESGCNTRDGITGDTCVLYQLTCLSGEYDAVSIHLGAYYLKNCSTYTGYFKQTNLGFGGGCEVIPTGGSAFCNWQIDGSSCCNPWTYIGYESIGYLSQSSYDDCTDIFNGYVSSSSDVMARLYPGVSLPLTWHFYS